MKIITLHCDYIKFKPLKKAIKNPEELKDLKEKEVDDPLVVLVAVEQGDNDKSVKEMVEAVEKTAKDVKAQNIVIYPYAHLSSNLAHPDTALGYLTEAQYALEGKKFNVVRAPFGYYKEFELKVKGHPLSELSKEFKGDIEIVKNIPKELKGDVVHDSSQLLKEMPRSKLDTSKLKDNDHRILGQKFDLFSFNESSPGSVFWHPKGMIIFNELINFSREIQHKAGYTEVSTPQVFDNKLWKISGHWDHYKNNLFVTNYEGKESALKPMNCPGHMLLFRTKTRSYKDLPLRFSEYGPLHRMELSGTLNGLFRVIRMHQDDTHIFCAFEQLESEVEGIFKIIKKIYKDTFNLEYRIELSTRPDKFMGKKEDWDKAEEILEKIMKKLKISYKVNKGDGAFYGPKIDIHIKDSLDRSWQCGTIQLDMQLPARFQLEYTGEDNKAHTPLVLHRAIFGSLERFIGILLEHLNGNLPLWLSPVQIKIINFTDRNIKSAEKVLNDIKKEIPSIRIESDFRGTTINDKIRDAEMQRIPYIIVIGDKEEEKGTLAVRARGQKPVFGVSFGDFVKDVREKIEGKI